MTRSIICHGVVLPLLLIAFQAWAWGPTGHRVVAEIGQDGLAGETGTTCSVLLKGLTLADVANWPDEVRDDPRFKALEPLHFADFPPGVKRYQDVPKKPEGDVVIAIKVLTQYLKTNDASVLKAIPAFGDGPNPISIDPPTALKLLVHFVADVHQPLHVGFDGELGGNKTRVLWMKRDHTSLHGIWDEFLVDGTKLSYTELAHFLERLTPEERKVVEDMDPENWANESIALHDQIYTFPDDVEAASASSVKLDGSVGAPTQAPDHVVSYKYISANRDTLHKRLYVAGVRLAKLINSIYPSAPKP